MQFCVFLLIFVSCSQENNGEFHELNVEEEKRNNFTGIEGEVDRWCKRPGVYCISQEPFHYIWSISEGESYYKPSKMNSEAQSWSFDHKFSIEMAKCNMKILESGRGGVETCILDGVVSRYISFAFDMGKKNQALCMMK